MSSAFEDYSQYYNLIYRDKDYSEETEYVISNLKEMGITDGRILEFGSGTGIHGNCLASCGYSVHGIELSDTMVRESEVTSGFTCQQGNITNTVVNDKFDAVVSLFHVISYLNTNQDVVDTFKNAARHLQPGGVFLFDVWYSPAVYQQKPEVRVKRIENEEIEVLRIAEPVIAYNENIVEVHYSIIITDKETGKTKKLQEVHKMRHFSLPELQIIAEATGFELVKAEEFLTGKTPSENTWGVCFLFRLKS